MLISEIPFPGLRETAIGQSDGHTGDICTDIDWAESAQGWDFWLCVNEEKYDIAYALNPRAFSADGVFFDGVETITLTSGQFDKMVEEIKNPPKAGEKIKRAAIDADNLRLDNIFDAVCPDDPLEARLMQIEANIKLLMRKVKQQGMPKYQFRKPELTARELLEWLRFMEVDIRCDGGSIRMIGRISDHNHLRLESILESVTGEILRRDSCTPRD